MTPLQRVPVLAELTDRHLASVARTLRLVAVAALLLLATGPLLTVVALAAAWSTPVLIGVVLTMAGLFGNAAVGLLQPALAAEWEFRRLCRVAAAETLTRSRLGGVA